MRSHSSVVTALVLTGALASVAPPAVAADSREGVRFELRGATPVQARAGDAARLVSATGTFTERATGMPLATAAPHQRLVAGATVEVTYSYHWETDALEYHYSVDADVASEDPGTGPETDATLGLGVFSGDTCVINAADTDYVSGSSAELLLYDYGSVADAPGAGAWNCAVLYTHDGAASTTYDAYVTALTVTTATPQLSISAPGQARLVPGVWTEIPVTLANAADGVDARNVTVTGGGRGTKVRTLEIGSLTAGDDDESHVWVKLTRAKARLRLALNEEGQKLGSATVRLSRRAAPPAPTAGRWEGDAASFVVRRGKLLGFRVATQTTCGGFPEMPSTMSSTYDFPGVAIPRNNVVSKADRGNVGSNAAYSVYLRVSFVSRTRAKGTFVYSGPDRCHASAAFTVRRRG